MFEGNKRRGGKSQETQSSVTRIFQALKDNKCSDGSSETVNLVKTPKKKCKSKTGAQSQTENKHVSCDCTNTGQQTNGATPSNRDDTFSFTSCTLKKLITSESPKLMMALIVLGAALALLLLLKCICCPAIFTDITEEKRERRSDDATKDDRKPWEKSKSRLMNEFAQLTGNDIKESNLHSGDVDYPENAFPELASIIDPVKVNEGYGSNNLREFYRKLLKTDIQIKNLKKGLTNIKRGNSIDFTDPNSPRMKRSYKMFRDTPGSHAGSFSLKRRIENPKHHLREWRVDNDYGNTGQDDTNIAQPNENSSSERILEKQKERKLEADTSTAKSDVFSEMQPVDKANNALEHLHFKHFELFNALFGRERPSTQHRRLLQHDDDEDKDKETNYDYEDQTKEPWDREKRTVNPAELNNEKQSEIDPIHFPKTTNSESKTPTHEYSNEINYLIEAAVRMAKGKLDAVKCNQNHPRSLQNSNAKYFEDNGNYEDLVELAQAYSDYGVLNNKKEIVEKNKPIGNTIKLLSSEKPHKILEQMNKVDNSLHGQRVKLKSNTEKPHFLKKLRLKIFSHKVITTTTPLSLSARIANFTHYVTSAPWNVFGQKKTQKHKERNVMYSGHKRSLKSLEVEELNDDAAAFDNVEKNFNNNENSTIVYAKLYTNNEGLGKNNERNKSKNESNKINETNDSVNIENIAPKLSDETLKRNNTAWGVGEIFSMFADFFMFMSGFDENREESGYGFLYDLVIMLNPKYSQTKNKTTQNITNVTIAPIEASIDLEMVDNIGHRSRVLLSFEEKAENATKSSVEIEGKSESYVITTNKEVTNTTKEINKANSSLIENKNPGNEAANRTVVKRSANGNVIFWNDLYDDEYGVKDPMEDDMKEKSSVKFNELIGKDNWISNKFKMLARNLKERRNRKMEAKKNRKLKNSRNKTKAHAKRAVPVIDVSGKNMFEDLTANMKKVCHEAAQAIRETTNREVRADSGQASALMQQLVSLMSELVDMQVQAKTCVQLPEDLRSFLVWLTAPNNEERDEFSVNSYDSPNSVTNTETYDLLSNNARSECLGTIQDVEDLIMQYDEMSEEDKSKMSGVREYLEHQLYYLHKQLSNFNEYGSLVMYQEPTRRRRQPNSNKKQRKRKPFRFINFGRKLTKSTDFDDLPTEDYKLLKFGKNKNKNEYYKHDDTKDREVIENNFRNNNAENEKGGNRKNENDMKRNLKDDYYRDLVKNNDTIF